MDGFEINTMSWNPAMPVQAEQHLSIPVVPLDQYDQRSTFDAETFAG